MFQVVICVAVLYYPRGWRKAPLANEELVSMIHELLKRDADLDFQMVFRRKDLEKLVACVRARVGRVIVEKGRGRTQERKECVLCRML